MGLGAGVLIGGGLALKYEGPLTTNPALGILVVTVVLLAAIVPPALVEIGGRLWRHGK